MPITVSKQLILTPTFVKIKFTAKTNPYIAKDVKNKLRFT